MLDLSIITPTGDFPDPETVDVLAQKDAVQIADTVGMLDVIQELVFQMPNDGPKVRYLLEPELEIPCLLLDGPEHEMVAQALRDSIACISAMDAAMSYDETAELTIKITLLRILSAHALEGVSDAMIAVAHKALRDASPYVRLGAVQLAQYANDDRISRILADHLPEEDDPDVRGFAEHVLDLPT